MTVLIGFSFPELTVLAADGRGIAVDNREDVIDDMQKIYKTAFGLMAGAGRSDVVEAVTNRFENHVPASNQEASDGVRAEVAKLGLAADDPALERTCWLASYVTNIGSGRQAQLALATRADNYSFGSFPHFRVVVIAPAGMPEDLGRQFNAEAQARFDRRIRDAPLEERLSLCVLLISSLVRAIAERNDSVGPNWCVGYQDIDNVVRVSNVGDNLDAMGWH